ncbi:uncharacterized protein LOC111349356 [Spodoptera litura]|uniref:Uncharacterized protein LOC111349356 n=1 Tax=Spodoptera litura TaxID=69820 RepID=A0A9J7IJD2_SPOLT|nr:uncharacterized protein LOC111349356 [Spodoptera litura]
MVVKLYVMDFSPPVRACLMACEVLNAPYERVELDLYKRENHTPEYLAKNPMHTIPIMEDGDLILRDSHAIMAYLSDTYAKDDSWYPKDVKKRAAVNDKLFFNAFVVFSKLRVVTYYVLQKGYKKLEQEWLDRIEEAYSFIEAFLSKTEYIAGDDISIADLALFSNVSSLEHMQPIDTTKFPKTISWLDKMKAKPFSKKHNEKGVKDLDKYIKDCDMGVKLYAADFSPPVRSSMMALDIFNVPFEKITLDLLKLEHHDPKYVEKNPIHTIPVLEDGDLTLHDSHAIMAYLADTYGKDDSWYPKDIKKRALVNQKLFFTTGVIFPRLRIITYYLLQKGRKAIEQEWLDNIEEAIGFVEQFLSRTKFIALDHVTIADVAVLSHLSSVEPILPIDPEKYPKTVAWLEIMKATPYCKKYNEEGVKSLTAIIMHAIGKK